MTLAVVDPDVCPECGGRLETLAVGQPALIRHGGYGATRRTAVRFCTTCPYALSTETSEARP
ncbi:MAG: hypothetical protein L0206_16785 [Actinobacteria bacterium]|nr:hypothetical protein [Actinomycetota bacterium]